MATTAKYEELAFEGSSRALVRCASCRASGYAGEAGWQGTISHGKRCEWLPRQTTAVPAGGAAELNGPVLDPTSGRFAGLETDGPAPAPRAERTEADWRAIRRHARRGEISSVLTDDEIVDAVAAGRISASDAMNRDY